MSSSRLRICACTDTSRADTGSSQMSSLGSSSSARAMLTRWHWPPESSCGRRSHTASGSRPTASRISPTRAVACGLPALRQISRGSATMSPDPAPRVERRDRVLEDHLQRGRSGRRSPARRPVELAALEAHRPGGRAAAAGSRARPAVDFPHPDSPTMPSVSPAQHVEADVGDRVHLAAPPLGSRRRGLRPAAAPRPARRCAVPLPAISCSCLRRGSGEVAGDACGRSGRRRRSPQRRWVLRTRQRRCARRAGTAARTGSPTGRSARGRAGDPGSAARRVSRRIVDARDRASSASV